MRRPHFIAEQTRHANGLLGRLIAFIMARETWGENKRTIDALGVEEYDMQALPADIYRFPATIDVLAALTAAGFAIESIDERDEIGGLEPMFEALPASESLACPIREVHRIS